ncbi:hypothetical protein UFOVP528_48 [uncultured Caudovirales phage]|uniref:Uncharacterized protein n=1 Tax=uncultured Caudovirales phage TaxID=2100421 RepID=A0A6J5MVV7_9CAUD|nr:hypothetical protein UFOVP528_48 [uncultured Caudovirales phage]
MTLSKYICVILFIAPIFCKGQSICIDSLTLRNANLYLIKGAKAREENRILKAKIQNDSNHIVFLDSTITDLEFGICEVEQENRVIKERFYSVTIYAIIVTIFYIFK